MNDPRHVPRRANPLSLLVTGVVSAGLLCACGGASPALHKLLPSSVAVTHGDGGEFTICATYHPPGDAGAAVTVVPP